MYTLNELEEAVDTLESTGWKIILKHIQEAIDNYTGLLIDSSDTEDEKLKGKIQALQRDVLTLKEEFFTMLSEEKKRRKELEEAK